MRKVCCSHSPPSSQAVAAGSKAKPGECRRLGLWRGLTNPSELTADEPEEREDLSHTYARRDRRELAADIDPASAVLLLIGAVAAPVTMPQLVRRTFGTDVSDPDFEEQYANQLRHIIRWLALPLPDDDESATGTPPDAAP
ncbi:hypothetical protein [Streptomyces sviceus]|uniref:hypothetical protein n=1 Tax=Streptomyces sviceus TaxID=285530 RepID=UPI003326CD69